MKKVLGIGGVFFKSPNPEKLRAWYKEYLGVESESWGAQFDVIKLMKDKPNAYQVWCAFKEDTKYFTPSTQPFMINFIVDDLVALRNYLVTAGVTVMPEMEETEYGKFGWCLDCDGNKIELWEPS